MLARAKDPTQKAAEAFLKTLSDIDVNETQFADWMSTLHGPKLDRWHRIVLDYIDIMANTPHPQKVDKTIQCQRMLDGLYR